MISCFLIVLICLMLLDALPTGSKAHKSIVKKIDPVLDVTGLWQGRWRLFAPSADKVNTRLSARITFSDGSTYLWDSPSWSEMSAWQRFTQFRHMEYFDSIRTDKNSGAWDSLARYLGQKALGQKALRQAANANIKRKRQTGTALQTVVLSRHSAEIPPPQNNKLLPAGPYTKFARSQRFHTWRP